MTSSPNVSDIITALRSSGYLMEQQVATQFEELDLHVWTNWAFEDIEEGKSRELDVRAIKKVARNEEKKLSAFIEIIAECKNNSNPFVFLRRLKNDTDNRHSPEEMVFPIAKYGATTRIDTNRTQTNYKDAFFHLGFDQVHQDFISESKSVQFCRIDRKGKNWEANHGGLYNSTFYPMAKALMARKREILKPLGRTEERYFWFLVPVVVISGDIYSVDSGLPDPEPEPISYVTFKREIRSGNINGTFALNFVRQNKLEQSYSDCLQSVVQRMVDLTLNKADFVLNKDIQKEDLVTT